MKQKKPSCLIITNKNSWVSEPIIERLYHDNSIELKLVLFYSAKINWKLIRKRLFQYGLSKIFWKMIDIIKNTKATIIPNNNKSAIKTSFQNVLFNKIPFQFSSNLNSIETIELINKQNPDIVLVCSCSQIFKSDFLKNKSITYLNLHDSLLPLHKGPSPSFWVLYNDEKYTGYTIHKIVEKIDEGEIFYQEKITVENVFSEEQLIQMVTRKASEKISEILLNLSSLKNEKIEEVKSSYEGLPTLKQRKELLRNLKNKR
jgi:methionyl-tRNA formyltransferase